MDFEVEIDTEQSPLSPAENRVYQLLIAGKPRDAMSLVLHRSIKTVDTHLLHIFQKLNVDNAQQAITVGFVRGIVKARQMLVLMLAVASGGNAVLPSRAYADVFDEPPVEVPFHRVRVRGGGRARFNRGGRGKNRKQEQLWLDCFGDF